MRRANVPTRPSDGPRAGGALVTAPVATDYQIQSMAMEVGRFFQDLRRALDLSQLQVARRVGCRIDVVAALEGGQMWALPAPPETRRIIARYTDIVGLDPRPVLRSIEMLMAAEARASKADMRLEPPEEGAPALEAPARKRAAAASAAKPAASKSFPPRVFAPRPKKLAPPPPMAAALAPVAPVPAEEPAAYPSSAGFSERLRDFWEGRFARTARALFAVTVPVALVLLITQTSVLEAAVAKLPPSVARIVRGAQNYVIVQLAPVRDGMRWIDVPDPRSRRSDKLRTTAQSD